MGGKERLESTLDACAIMNRAAQNVGMQTMRGEVSVDHLTLGRKTSVGDTWCILCGDNIAIGDNVICFRCRDGLSYREPWWLRLLRWVVR